MYYFSKNIINTQLYGLQHFYVESTTLFRIVKILSIPNCMGYNTFMLKVPPYSEL